MVAHHRGPDFLRQGLETETVVAASDDGLIIPASQVQREDKDRKRLVVTLRKDSRAPRAFPHTHIYNAQIYINRTWWAFVLFQGWPFFVGQPIRGFVPGRGLFSFFQESIIACSSWFRTGTTWKFPFFYVNTSTDIAIVLVLFMHLLVRNHFTAHFPVFWLLPSFCSLFHEVLWATDAGAMIQMYLLGLSSAQSSCFNYLYTPKRLIKS